VKFIQRALDWLFPNYTCLVCKCELNNSDNIYACDKCVTQLAINVDEVKLVNESETQYFQKGFAPFVYDGDVTKLILSLKYNNNGLVAEFLAPFMAATILRYKIDLTDFEIVPVPLCKKRRKFRGYNQSELLADEVAKHLGLKVDTNILTRIKDTTPQKKMTVVERRENLDGAFATNNTNNIVGRSFIIVDDVFTSGSTTNECAKMLIGAGASCVYVLVAAKVEEH